MLSLTIRGRSLKRERQRWRSAALALSLSLTAALRSVTFCLVNPGWRVKVDGFFSLPRIFAGETNDATNVRSRRAATIKWMGSPVITE